jgi:hypothetical protein
LFIFSLFLGEKIGTEHPVLTNCLECGKIICQKEGQGTCLFCGSLENKDADISIDAIDHKNKLIEYDRTAAQRTIVYG